MPIFAFPPPPGSPMFVFNNYVPHISPTHPRLGGGVALLVHGRCFFIVMRIKSEMFPLLMSDCLTLTTIDHFMDPVAQPQPRQDATYSLEFDGSPQL